MFITPLVQQELQRDACVHRLRMHLMNRQLELFLNRPMHPVSLDDFLKGPIAEMLSKLSLILPKNGNFQVCVSPRHSPEEQIDRPSAGDAPGRVEAAHQRQYS